MKERIKTLIVKILFLPIIIPCSLLVSMIASGKSSTDKYGYFRALTDFWKDYWKDYSEK